MIYLDHNASAPLSEPARSAIHTWLAGGAGNPSSIHMPGQRARAIVEQAREDVAASIGAEPAEVVFTSGATEANHIAWLGIAAETSRTCAVASTIEHPSVFAAAARTRLRLRRIPVDAGGLLHVEEVHAGINDLGGPSAVGLVSIMSVNNETGGALPVAAIARFAREHGIIMHTDATQLYGRKALNVAELGVDLLTLSGHKVGALPGIGALYVRRGTALAGQLGGHQEDGLRGGTENVVGIASLGAAAARIDQRIKDNPRQRALRDELRTILIGRVPDVQVHGPQRPDDEVGNVLNVAFAGVPGPQLVMALDVEGLAVSSGAACASGTLEPSHVLTAMEGANAAGAIRISLGVETTDDEIARSASIVENIVARIRSRRY